MKKNLLILSAAACICIACNNASNSDDKSAGEDIIETVNTTDNTGINALVPDSADVANDAGTPSFQEDTFEFGLIEEGEKVNHVFTFTNVGKTPLIINDVKVGCGCTTPKFDKRPVNPGEKGTIEVGFNSAGQRGKQHKIITVQSNGQPSETILHLKGEVN